MMFRYVFPFIALCSFSACIDHSDDAAWPTSRDPASKVGDEDVFVSPDTTPRVLLDWRDDVSITASERSARTLLVSRWAPYASLEDDRLVIASSIDPLYHDISQLPENLTIRGSVDLRGTSIKSLPNGLRVGGNLYLAAATQRLSGDMHIGGDLVIGSAQLLLLPPDTTIDGNLDLSNSSIFYILPGLRVGGNLVLNEFLSELPADLYIGGNLLANRGRLISFPVNLVVAGDCDFTGHAPLLFAPGLSVGGNLMLPRGMGPLPYDINVVGQITREPPLYVAPPPSLEDRADQAPFARIDSFPSTHLDADPLPPRQSPSFWGEPITPCAQVSAVLARWRQTASIVRPIDDLSTWNLTGDDANAIETFSGKVQSTPAYRIPAARRMLSNLMVDIFQAMHTDSEFRAVTIAMMVAANVSCGDRALDTLNQIEAALRLRQVSSTAMSEQQLRAVGLSFFKLDLVRQIAREHARAHRNGEEIEVILAFESHLARPLGLPITEREMLYERCANLRESDYQNAIDRVRRTVADPQACTQFLNEWGPWQAYLRRPEAQLSYEQLPVRRISRAELYEDQKCPITLESIADLEQPLCIGATGPTEIYESAGFMTWWVENGTHVITREVVPASALHRVEIFDP